MTTSSSDAPETTDLAAETQTEAPQAPRSRVPLVARVILVALVVAITLAAYLGVCYMRVPFLRGHYGYILPDPDSNFRWRMVTQAVRGESTRPPTSLTAQDAPLGWMDTDNAPFGRPNEWTKPMTAIGVAAVWATEQVTGSQTPVALEITPMWLGPAVGVAIGLALLVMGWRLAGCAVGLAWLVAWPALSDLLMATEPGIVDHHGFHCLLVVLIYGGLLVARRRWRPGGAIFVGLTCAMGIWSGATEFLPLLVPVVFLAIWDVIKPPATDDADLVRAFWKRWWIAGLLGTAAAMLLQFGPEGVLHTQLEFLSIWHVAFWAVLGVSLVVLSHAKRLALAIPVTLIVAAGVLIALAGALKGFDFTRLHTVQDDVVRRFMSMVAETQPVRGFKKSLTTAFYKFGLLPLGLLLAARMLVNLNRGERFLFLSALFFGELALWQGRWSVFFAPLAIMTAGLMVSKLIPRPRWTWAVPIVLLLAVLPTWREQYLFYRAARDSQWQSILGDPTRRQMLARDTIAHDIARFTGGRRAVVLAPAQFNPYLGGTDGAVGVIGSCYWTNKQGLLTMWEMLTTTDDQRFRELLNERRVSFILDAGPRRMTEELYLAYVGLHGWDLKDPGVRERILQEIPRTSFWRFVYTRETGFAESPRMDRFLRPPELPRMLWLPLWRMIIVPPEFSIPAELPSAAPHPPDIFAIPAGP